MRNFENLTAILNLKEQPNVLFVAGDVLTYHDDDRIEIVEAKPQGINPAVLILDIEVKEGRSPMKGTMKQFCYVKKGDDLEQYTQITVRYNNDSKTVDIQKLL